MARYIACGLVVLTTALLYQHFQASAEPPTPPSSGIQPSVAAKKAEPAKPIGRPNANRTDTFPSGSKPKRSPSLFRVAADLIHGGTRVADDVVQEFAGLTPEEEKRIGDQVHKTLLAKNKIMPEESARLARLAEPLLRNTRNRTFEYTFTAIDSPQFNAFAHIGGHIYFYKGLMDVAENDEELLFVLAHEIAHVEREHVARHAAYAKASREMGGGFGEAVAQLVYSGISRGYSEDLELEADEWSYNTLRSQGLPHDRAISFLFKMAEVERQHGRTNRKDDDSIGTIIGDHFRTHPPSSVRIRQLETLRKHY